MSALGQIAHFQDRRDEIPNVELAKQLAEKKDKKGIQEIADNLLPPQRCATTCRENPDCRERNEQGQVCGCAGKEAERYDQVAGCEGEECDQGGREALMPWIKQISIGEATGLLKTQFDAALKRAGRVWHIVHIMSLNPRALRDSLNFYVTIMMGESPLTRVQRELLAMVVSAELGCLY